MLWAFGMACHGGSPGDADAGAADAADAMEPGARAIEAPAPPKLADLTPCPEGWAVETQDRTSSCQPFPQGRTEPCPLGQAHFPGRPGCEELGSPCPPEGAFPAGLPDDATVAYVRAGATGGDGSRADPFGAIGPALASLSGGGIVALAAGTYDAPVRLGTGQTLWGACPAETTVTDTDPSGSADATVTVTGRDATVRGIRIEGVWRGVWIPGGTSLELRQTMVRDTRVSGLGLRGDGRLTASRIVVEGTRADPAGMFGRGLELGEQASAVLRQAVLRGNADAGVFAALGGASVTLEDTYVVESVPSGQPATGRGVNIVGGASGRLERTVIEDNVSYGIFVADPGSMVTVRDSVVRGTRDPGTGSTSIGLGLAVVRGARAEMERTLVVDDETAGIGADGHGSILSMRHVIVRDPRPGPTGSLGRGISIDHGAAATGNRVTVEGAPQAGVFVASTETTAAFTDLWARDSLGTPDGAFGRGLVVQGGAEVTLERAALQHQRETALLATDETTRVTATDLLATDTEGRADNGTVGHGLHVQAGATLEGERIELRDNREVALVGSGSDTRITVRQTRIAETAVESCVERGLCRQGAGIGLGLYNDAVARVEEFVIEDNALAGVQLARGGAADVSDGVVRRNVIGVNLQVPEFDLQRLMQDVDFIDNERTLDSAELEVPEARLDEPRAGDPAP